MKNMVAGAVLLGLALSAGSAKAQNLANPYTFACSDYLAAQQGQERGQANAALYWAVGYLQARLAPLPTTTFNADTFTKDIQDVHSALLRICPNVPNLVIANFMNNLAGDFEKSARPQQ